MSTVAGRVALITGSEQRHRRRQRRGALAAGGAKLALASRRADDLGIDGALARACDVRRPEQVEALVAETVERFGGLDILVANAGVGAYGEFLELEPEHLEEMVDTNVKGLLYTVRAGLPHLLKSDAADLVVVASVAGQRGPEGEAVYAASKFAQVGFMRSLDHECTARRALLDDRARRRRHGVRDGARAHARGPRSPGMMRPEEIADAVVALRHPPAHAPGARGHHPAHERRLDELSGGPCHVPKVTIIGGGIEQLRPAADPPPDAVASRCGDSEVALMDIDERPAGRDAVARRKLIASEGSPLG